MLPHCLRTPDLPAATLACTSVSPHTMCPVTSNHLVLTFPLPPIPNTPYTQLSSEHFCSSISLCFIVYCTHVIGEFCWDRWNWYHIIYTVYIFVSTAQWLFTFFYHCLWESLVGSFNYCSFTHLNSRIYLAMKVSSSSIYISVTTCN